MTKAQYISIHGAAAVELVGTQLFIALTDTAREECPFIGKEIADPTGIVRNEGRLQGWMECLRFLKSAHVAPAPRQEHAPRGQYLPPHELNKPN